MVCASILSCAQIPSVGQAVYGDFNGDGVKEYAFAVQTHKGIGNAIDDGTPGAYSIFFSTESIPEIDAGCCEITLINEGDLNGNGSDEISLYQAPMNGNTFSMTTYSHIDSMWVKLVTTFLIPTGGNDLTSEELQNRVFIEDGVLYYYKTDVNDVDFRLIKTKVK
jgi:hypothetical protein